MVCVQINLSDDRAKGKRLAVFDQNKRQLTCLLMFSAHRRIFCIIEKVHVRGCQVGKIK